MLRGRSLLAVLATVFVVGTFSSCGRGPQSKGPQAKGPESAAPPGKIELRLRLEPGKAYKLRMTAAQKITQTLAGMKQEMPQTTGFELRHDVKEVRDDGTAVIRVTYDSFQYKTEGPMGKVDYDSSKPPAEEALHPMAKGFAALVGESFWIDLTPLGRATRVEGADQLAARVAAKIEVPMESLRATVEQQMKDQFGDQALKETMEQMMGIYPDQPVGVGDSWSKKMVVTRGMPVVINNTWTLKSRREGVAFIDVQSSVEPNPDAEPMEMGPAKVKPRLAGTQQGSIEMDEATGWVLRSTVKQQLSGALTIEGGPEQATVPMSVQSEIRVKGR